MVMYLVRLYIDEDIKCSLLDINSLKSRLMQETIYITIIDLSKSQIIDLLGFRVTPN